VRTAVRSALTALLATLAACSSDSSASKPAASSPTPPKTTTTTTMVSGSSNGEVHVSQTGDTSNSTTSMTITRGPASTTTSTGATVAVTKPAAAADTNANPEKENAMTATALPNSFYGFKTTTLEGKPADLSSYKGKVVLVVNTASQCGLTPQYKALEKLHEDYSAKGFSVLGFPSNDFGGQEPGTPTEIREFCDTNYHVTFPLFGKVQTKAGDGQSPIYTWLQDQTQQLPRWNFGKYLIGKDGKVVQVFDSKVTPDDPAVLAAIDKAIGS